jgi:hypothetical protein
MTKLNVRLALSVLILAAVFAGRWIDVRELAGPIKGDEATYVAMALSLAEDGDLYYEREDYTRFVELYGDGPSGIFLKRRYTLGPGGKTPVPADQSLAYGKALIYPLAAAPFAWLGGLGGLVVMNWLMLGACLWAGMLFTRHASGQRFGWLYGLAFIAASVVPVFAAWLTSEIFNFSLVFWAYFLWAYKKVAPAGRRTWLTGEWTTTAAVVLVGFATFSKASNAALVGPIVLDLLWQKNFRRAGFAVVVFVLSTAGLFALNGLITGEANYQGAADAASRRLFYNRYPFDDSGTLFDATGNPMITNDADTGRVLSTQIVEQLPLNVAYFFVGRHAGLVPYFLPGLVIAIVWFAAWRRSALWQWATMGAVAGSAAILVVLMPDSWNGGGGPPGNRYFLSLYPPLLFLVPAGARVWSAVASLVVGVAFVGLMVARPYAASAEPWKNVERMPLKALPIEITLLLDLPYRLNPLRGPTLFVQEPTVQTIFMDANTYLAEGQGFWIAGGDTAESIIRTERPLRRVVFIFESRIDNTLNGTFGGRPVSATIPGGGQAIVTVSQPKAGRYLHSYTYVLKLTTAAGFVPAESEPGSTDTRNLGVFVRPSFVYYEDASAE